MEGESWELEPGTEKLESGGKIWREPAGMETERKPKGQNAYQMEFKTTTVTVTGHRVRNATVLGPSETPRWGKCGAD